jgi:hypothetical protein
VGSGVGSGVGAGAAAGFSAGFWAHPATAIMAANRTNKNKPFLPINHFTS